MSSGLTGTATPAAVAARSRKPVSPKISTLRVGTDVFDRAGTQVVADGVGVPAGMAQQL
ncbi:hypothetical protein [Streptomyces sp. PR69]|uniref:hypothetical protein n=1 Tax=Streptomyces sp. PR69 TaxID=2984950 RepID=UPI0022652A1A|nr:hypothetical protein [Streptomyces sp. PR69]